MDSFSPPKLTLPLCYWSIQVIVLPLWVQLFLFPLADDQFSRKITEQYQVTAVFKGVRSLEVQYGDNTIPLLGPSAPFIPSFPSVFPRSFLVPLSIFPFFLSSLFFSPSHTHLPSHLIINPSYRPLLSYNSLIPLIQFSSSLIK